MQCRNCGHDNVPEANFCANCGAILVTAIERPSAADITATKRRRISIWCLALLIIIGIGYGLVSLLNRSDYVKTAEQHTLPPATTTPPPTATSLAGPKLSYPTNGAVLDNGRSNYTKLLAWDFSWSRVEGATEYNIYVTQAQKGMMYINKSGITGSTYHYDSRSYIKDEDLHGWTWKVRAKVGNQWTEWSEVWTFDVVPSSTAAKPLPATTGSPPTVPSLLSPKDGAILPQPGSWDFDWADSSDPAGIRGYQIYVIGGKATLPIIDAFVTSSSYSEFIGAGIMESNRYGWTWKVRAQNNAGVWSEWSPTRTFDVAAKPS